MNAKSKKASTRAVSKNARNKAKDYGNAPFFEQQAEASKKVMEKYGLPKEWLPNKKQ